MLFTEASKCAYCCVLTHSCEQEINEKIEIPHPTTYMSGLFHGSQMNWAELTKEAYAIYMSVKKLAYYSEDSIIMLKIDHLHLRKVLEKIP